MIGDFQNAHPTVQIPPQWDPYDDPTPDYTSTFQVGSGIGSPDSFGSLRRYLLSNDSDEFSDLLLDTFSSDNFRMYDFKVRRCARSRSHDWTECPFAHPGEKARRRDPRKYNYSGTACPEFRKGACRKGDACEYAHGVFESWLHPDRYRTQPCKDGMGCRRRICFFAHSSDQLRVMSSQSPRPSLVNSTESYNDSPLNKSFDSCMSSNTNANTMSFGGYGASTNSPPGSPTMLSSNSSYNEMVSSMRCLQLAKENLSPTSAWGLSIIGSPRGGSNLRPGFGSMPSTPTRVPLRSGLVQFDDVNEEVALERVESGRDLRAKIYAKLSKENSFGADRELCDPDVGWISDLVQ